MEVAAVTPTPAVLRAQTQTRRWDTYGSLLCVSRPERRAQLLALLQAADLAVTQLSPAYGEEHLDHLGVPKSVRPLLPLVKSGTVVALVATARRPRLRPYVGAGLVAYYSAALTFHVQSGDSPADAAPAACCALLAASLL